jgi:hypothetical protein
MSIIGYHGTTRASATELIASGSFFRLSANLSDWLGRGFYFWQDAPQRAAVWARRSGLAAGDIVVIKAEISLDGCLDLFDLQTYHELRRVYPQFVALEESRGFSWHQSELVVRSGKATFAGASAARSDIQNFRDRALIDWYVEFLRSEGIIIRSVRGVFLYGSAIFRQSFLFDWSHSQIAVIDTSAISNPMLVND